MSARRNSILCLVAGMLVISGLKVQASEARTLTVTVNEHGSVPYLYFDERKQAYLGLVPDFLNTLAEKDHFTIEYIDAQQRRSERNLLEGKADLYMANPGWLTHPDRLIASASLISHATYLYSAHPFPQDFSVTQASGATVCTHRTYVYTGIESLFENGTLVRVDSLNHDTMAKMLARGRCDYAVYNDYNAMDVLYAPDLCSVSIYQSPQPTSEIDLPLVMRSDATDLKALIDRRLREWIDSGGREASLERYAPRLTFPKKAVCD